MPDEDPGDVFLRHRAAVLDALLSDPSDEEQPSAPVTSGAPPAAASVAGVSAPPSIDVPSYSAAEPPLSAPPRSRTSGGPSATDRINALLSGGSPASAPAANEFPEIPTAVISPGVLHTDVADADTDTAASVTSTAKTSKTAESSSKNLGGGLPPMDVLIRDARTQLRKPKVMAAVGVCLALLLVLILVFTSGEDEKQQTALIITPPPQAPVPTAGPTNAQAASGQIQVKSATHKCPPGGTDAMDAFDSQNGKAWSCMRAYSVDGQVLTINLGKTYTIDSVGLVPGWDHVDPDGGDEWTKHRTARKVSYQFDDSNRTTYTQETLDQRKLVVTKIDPPVRASKIYLTILQSTGDASLRDTAISSIAITGH